jgi:hypothetical protein
MSNRCLRVTDASSERSLVETLTFFIFYLILFIRHEDGSRRHSRRHWPDLLPYLSRNIGVNVLCAGESFTLMFDLLFVFAMFRTLRSFGFA